MRRHLAIISLFLAWLCANGAVWDAAQVLAWTRMFTGYAESLPVGEALRETFDGSKPCSLCQAITKAKAAEQAPTSPSAASNEVKLTLALESPVPVFLLEPSAQWMGERVMTMEARVEPVPVPPPRA